MFFISVINQLDAHNLCFTKSLFHASTCFEHMCSKHVEAWNKLTVKQKFCASSWLITEISILRYTVSKTSKLKCVLNFSTPFVWNVSRSRKSWTKCDPKCILDFKYSTRYSYPIVMKLQFSLDRFKKKNTHIKSPEGRDAWRPRRRWVDNIRMDLQEVGWGYVNWIGLAQDRDRWRKLVSAVMNLRVLWNAVNFLTSCKPVSFSWRTLHHGVSMYSYKIHENSSNGSRVIPCGQTDGHTYMMQPIFTFRNFASAP